MPQCSPVELQGRTVYDYRRIGFPLQALGLIGLTVGLTALIYSPYRRDSAYVFLLLPMGLPWAAVLLLTYFNERVVVGEGEMLWINRLNREALRCKLNELISVEEDTGEGSTLKITTTRGSFKVSDALTSYDQFVAEVRTIIDSRA